MARWVCARGLRGQRLTEGQLDWVYRVTGGYGYTCFRPIGAVHDGQLSGCQFNPSQKPFVAFCILPITVSHRLKKQSVELVHGNQ